MCHTRLHDPKRYALLLQAGEERAAQVRAVGCCCGEVLHCAGHIRKALGTTPDRDAEQRHCAGMQATAVGSSAQAAVSLAYSKASHLSPALRKLT